MPNASAGSSGECLLGRLAAAERSLAHADYFSYLFVAKEFIAELIELGRADASTWLRETHSEGLWHVGPLRTGHMSTHVRSRARRDTGAPPFGVGR